MITISRKLAIINGFVEIPNTKIESKTAVLPTSVLSSIAGTKRVTINGSRLRSMRFVEFPAAVAYNPPIVDYYEAVKALM